MFIYLIIIITFLWVLYLYFGKHQFVVGKVPVKRKQE